MDKIRVLVVDDHPLFRQGVVTTLEQEPNMVVVGQAGDAAGAIAQAQDLLPDVVLLDITMPGGDGLQAARAIARDCPVSKIVMLTVAEDEDALLASLKAGARGYLLKGVSAHELAEGIRAVHRGEVVIAPAMAASLLVEMTQSQIPGDEAADPVEALTERERQILELVAQGLTNKEIGATLNLAEATVKHYMTNILQKLHVRSRVEAAIMAHKEGWF
ncbi:MAG: response regulator [Anaerolineae bacterium]